ncbi:hypothetical protein ACEE21_15105 [Clostridium baratii]
MVNIYSKVWDLRKTNCADLEEELKEELLEGFKTYCRVNAVDFVWVGEGKADIVEDVDLKEEFEDEIRDELEAIYEDFIGG